MKRTTILPLALVLALLALGALACDLSTNTAATALAPTPVPPPGTAVAEGGGAIQSGDQMSSTLRQQGEEDLYTFHGEAGQAVTIEMQAGSGGGLDSYLELRGPDGAMLIRDDDSAGNLNSRISNYVLPVTGEYTIAAYSFNHGSTGAYGLRMNLGTPAPTVTPSPTPESGGGAVAVGQTVAGELHVSGQVDIWMFQASADDIVTIDMRGVDTSLPIDTFIELISPTGQTLIVNDDGGDGLNSQIANQRLSSSGTYLIRASALNGATGPYELALSVGLPPTATPPPPTIGPSPTPFDRSLGLGEALEDTFFPRTVGNRYLFQVSEPIMLEITLQGEDDRLPLYVDLFDSNGTVVQSTNGFNSPGAIIVLSVALHQTGQYQVRVYSYEDSPVPYTLALSPGEALVSAAGEIRFGQGLSGELVAVGQHEEWTFEGRAGEVVTIIMNGVNMDSYLELQSPSGTSLVYDDDGNGALDSRIDEFTLPEDGAYTIIARSLNNSGYGPYRLLLFRISDPAVE